MNCDQAFDAMTDPSGPDSPELWRHLSGCPRCRQMYETLEPALGLFAAVEPKPGESSPALAMQTTASPFRLAQRIAHRLGSAGTGSADGRPRRRLWGAVLAATVAGFVLSVGLDSMRTSPQPPETPAGCSWFDRERASNDESARAVVVRCAACHLSQPGEGAADQAGVGNFSQDWERFLSAWQARLPSPAIEPWLMAANPPDANLRARCLRCRGVDVAGRSAWCA